MKIVTVPAVLLMGLMTMKNIKALFTQVPTLDLVVVIHLWTTTKEKKKDQFIVIANIGDFNPFCVLIEEEEKKGRKRQQKSKERRTSHKVNKNCTCTEEREKYCSNCRQRQRRLLPIHLVVWKQYLLTLLLRKFHYLTLVLSIFVNHALFKEPMPKLMMVCIQLILLLTLSVSS